MKKLLRLIALLLTVAFAHADAKDPISDVLSENYGEVVFTRQESSGSLNIIFSTVMCDEWPRVVLVGGEAGGVYLRAGDYKFQVFSPEPYVPDSPSRACQSPVLLVKVRKGKKVFLQVIPELGDEKQKIEFHWTLKETETR